MIDIVTMITVLFAGLLLGAFFFGGLLWTVKRGLSSKHPGFWFLGSWLVRIIVILGSFYLVSAGGWERMLVCASGFFIARFIVIRLTRSAEKKNSYTKETVDAS
jgi:F1F0 ATPase subunit 2